ncbi:MAG TPA: exodeoxyribonuclease VII large subunit [Terriglobia bacterium]|nr:exodeoxyribonuclease VII large subunit [Terriglobia bacterium]
MSQGAFNFPISRKIYTVSALTQEIRNLIEPRFLDTWVTGEVSNFRAANSGHLYFTLKDESAQLRVVCFRNQARYLKFKPQDGVSLIARGSVSIYEPRGEYQLVAEYLEPAGLGALQLAFEQLKQTLATEGLFDPARKKPLPVLPRAVGVVTSPSGAVIQDILRVLRRRFRNMNVAIYPAKVQGEGAAEEIVEGIRYFNRHPGVDVLIVARGGGSIEDLWAFNEESVARAIAASRVPIISAVGHETDFTIADFVADLRAPTPSAAAEIVVRRKQDFETELKNHERRMTHAMRLMLSELRHRFTGLALHRGFQTIAARLSERAQHVDDLEVRLDRAVRQRLRESREAWLRASAGVVRLDLRRIIELNQNRLDEAETKLRAALLRSLDERSSRLSHIQAILHERNPLVILNRGYSITYDASGKVVRDASDVLTGGDIRVRLARGQIEATVSGKQS